MSTLSTASLESFRTACGAAGPLTLLVEGPEAGEVRERVLEQPFAVIGRDPRADLCLDEWHVSRRHAFVQLIEGRWFCVDLQSQTGTHWASGSQRMGWVDAVEGINIGPFRLRAASVPVELPSVIDPLNDRVPELLFLPRVSLEFLAGGLQQSSWRMSRMLALVGQAPDCKVRLVAPSVSKFHCALLRTRLGVWVVDLFSRNGIRVNGQELRSALLFDGDQIEVGQFIVRVRYDAQPQPRATDGAATLEGTNHKSPTADRNGETAPGAALNPLVVSEGKPTVLLPANQNEAEAEVVERLLVPLVNEFRLMQSQMFDQFQQAMSSMFNMFTSMHREQTDLIRDELDRLHQLTHELHELQAELSKLPPREAPAAAKPAAEAAPAPPPKTTPRPVPPPPTPAPPQPPAAPTAGVRPLPPRPSTTASTEDIHFWLADRMESIQRERQSSWQKIMNFLLGKGPQSS